MKKVKKDLSTSIAELLPNGITEDLIGKISKLVNEYTVEKVNEETAKLAEDTTRKVKAFIRGQIEKLKEQALKELELENETFRNAQMFETVRSMFAVELTGDDEITATNMLASIGESQDKKVEVLVGEVDRLLQENTRLKNTAKVLADKNTKLESSVSKLTENVNKLTENISKTQTKNLSDSAVVVSAETFKKAPTDSVKKTEIESVNEWLTPSIVKNVRTLNSKN